jgi:nucleoid-associated protein YgaU
VSFEHAHLLLENGNRIAFWFNPSTLHRERRANYNRCEAAGQAAPTLEYRGTDSQALSFELLLHAEDSKSKGDSKSKSASEVQASIKALEALIEPSVEVPDTNQRRPQRVTFIWGQYTSPLCVCNSVSMTIELFEPDGTPLRALVAITLTQAMPEPARKGQNPTTRATQRRRAHLVQAGETLAGIAYSHYHDPTRWRAIALANQIEDPMRLPVGSRLTIPLERA